MLTFRSFHTYFYLSIMVLISNLILVMYDFANLCDVLYPFSLFLFMSDDSCSPTKVLVFVGIRHCKKWWFDIIRCFILQNNPRIVLIVFALFCFVVVWFRLPDDVIKWKHFPRYWRFSEGNPSITGGFPSQRPVTRTFDVVFDLRLNKRLSKQSRRSYETSCRRSL